MGLTEFCLKKPVLVTVAVIFLLLAGIWALFSIPIQLTPDVETPKITVRTNWPGASPYEIEREIVKKQEEFLNNLPNLVAMRSESQPNRGSITLEFEIGTNMDAALLRITNELNQVPSYPENALRPTIILSGANSRPIIWNQIRSAEGNPEPIGTYKQWVEDFIKPEIEKISGISEARVYGGMDAEVQVRFDMAKLSLYGISVRFLADRIRSEIGDISAGTISEGKREYTIRALSPFRTPEQLGGMIVKTTPSGSIFLRDIAEVGMGYTPTRVSVLAKEGPSLVMPIYKEQGANVLAITRDVSATFDRLNRGLLKEKGLVAKRLSDPGYYINSAINLVLQNIMLGGFLAFVVLYLFLGNLRSALVVTFSIPISIIGTFVFMKILGRNINVISLAGLAFSVGMVMDATIVVLENIDKWRARGVPLFESVVKATREVYGAILASSLTTVAVFLPVVFVQDQAGQLFKDIAIAICVAIVLSFAVSTLVIPPAYQFLFGGSVGNGGEVHRVNRLTVWLGKIAWVGVEFLLSVLQWLQGRVWRKLALVFGTIAFAALAAYSLTPKLEYLPSGNRNLILSILFPPPGYSPKETEAMGRQIIDDLRPAMAGEEKGYPKIDRVFFVGFGTTLILGAIVADPSRVKEVIPLINSKLAQVPGMFFVTSQTSLFARGLAAGRSIDIEFYGNDIAVVAAIAQKNFARVKQKLPGSQIRPVPSFDLSKPEVRIYPIIERAAAAGLSVRELGMIVDVFTDGRKIAEFTTAGGETFDLRLMSGDHQLTGIQDFAKQPLLAPNNQYVTLASVATIEETVGPVQINRINQGRAFTLRVSPPANISLEEALETLQRDVVLPAQIENADVPGFRIALSGTADAFTKTLSALQTGFILAVAITFLLLVILFEDLLAPLVIIAMLPIASAGGLIGLWLINTFVATQALDMLTMLGFLMMIGIVVNNPILIVSMALNLMREQGKPLLEAVTAAVQARVRPIFMTTFTSVGGLMPLVLMPGAGSELYRGLGSAVLGGLVLSTLVTMVFVPTLFSLIQDVLALFRPRRTREGEEAPVVGGGS